MSKRKHTSCKDMESSRSRDIMISMFVALGKKAEGDAYIIADRALDILHQIHFKLVCEDQALRTFRRAIGSGQHIKNALIPLLIHAKESKLIEMIIRVLSILTIPTESLFSVEVMMRTKIGRHALSDVKVLLIESKELLTDARATRVIVDHMKNILEKGTNLTSEQCEQINDCLLLLRNIIHIPKCEIKENEHQINQIQSHNRIIWHLFMVNIDKVLIYLMSCSQREYWSVIMVQLIAVMFKDQHPANMLKLLNTCLQDALSDSTDDFESNTTAKDNSVESSPIVTSDQTSDSSDNCGIAKDSNNHASNDECKSSAANKNDSSMVDEGIQSSSAPTSNNSDSNDDKDKTDSKSPNNSSVEPNTNGSLTEKLGQCDGNAAATLTNIKISKPLANGDTKTSESDFGYGTLFDSFDNRTPKKVHQKPHRHTTQKNPIKVLTPNEQKEIRRKKLVKRSKSSLINMKGLVHHTPTDDDISNLLKEFTVDFLLKGYSCLIQDLHTGLVCDKEMHSRLDISHFFWLIGYFLKLAAQLELDLDHVKCVLSFEIVSYLTYEAMNQYEQLELMARFNKIDLSSYIDRLQTAVTAIQVLLQAVEKYSAIIDLSANDKNYIRLLRFQISVTDDLRHLFIILIRNYRPEIQTKNYLKDLIVTNHILLSIPENVNGYGSDKGDCNLKENVRPFATAEMMHQYGILLQNYVTNGDFVNDCIFTMMFHVQCLGEITALFEPNIIKIYSKIWATDYDLKDDWRDLVNQVMNKFVKTSKKSLIRLSAQSIAAKTLIEKPNKNEFCYDVWSKEEISVLHWYYEQSKASLDVVGQIVKLFYGKGIEKYRLSVIQHLLQQEIINRDEYNRFMKYEHGEYEKDYECNGNGNGNGNGDSVNQFSAVKSHGIQVLKEQLLKANKSNELLWLQKILIECCFAKLCYTKNTFVVKNRNEVSIIEPIPYQCILKRQPIPVIPWNLEQCAVLLYQPFMLLLHKLGFQLPVDAGKLFVRIPHYWTPDILFFVAEQLGPIDQSNLKFDIGEISELASRNSLFIASNAEQSEISEQFHNDDFFQFTHPHSSDLKPNQQICSNNTICCLSPSIRDLPQLEDSKSCHIDDNSFTFPIPHAMNIDSPISNMQMNIDTDTSSLTYKAGLSFHLNDQTNKRHNNDSYRDDKSSCNMSTRAYYNQNMELI